MASAQSLVSFVTRADNRVEVLLAVAAEARTRQQLQDDTGIARATLARILADFRDRELVRREGHRYEATTLGSRLAAELGELFDAVEEAQAIAAVEQWVPTSSLGFDIADCAGVSVTRPTPIDPMAPVKRAAAVVGNAPLVRAFCYSVVHAPILAEAQAVVDRGQRFEAVVAEAVLDVVAADPELAAPARELFESGATEVFVHPDAIDPQLIIAGRTTMFLVTGDDGEIKGLVEIDDESVLPWAESTFESVKAAAEPLDAASFADRLTP